jgi:hypothetical protein
VGTHGQLGQRPCLFVEPQWCTARCLTTVQAWCLKKSVLMGYMLQHPDWFIAAKGRLNQELARLIPRPPLSALADCGALGQLALPPAALESLYHRLAPRVVERTARVVERGAPISELLFLSSGLCTFDKEPLPPPAFLGLDFILAGQTTWPHPIVAMDRVEVWAIPVAAMADLMQRSPSVACSDRRKSSRYALLMRHCAPTRAT